MTDWGETIDENDEILGYRRQMLKEKLEKLKFKYLKLFLYSSFNKFGSWIISLNTGMVNLFYERMVIKVLLELCFGFPKKKKKRVMVRIVLVINKPWTSLIILTLFSIISELPIFFSFTILTISSALSSNMINACRRITSNFILLMSH